MAEHVTMTGHAPLDGTEPSVLGLDAPWFVAAAILAVIAIIVWKKVPGAIGRLLDRQIESIRRQLADAAQLRAEAETLRDEYQAKAAAAEAERQTILERARHEADAIVEQARTNAAALIERRRRMAEAKIAAAERQAIDGVRGHAASVAAAAAAKLLAEELDRDADRAMVDKTIAELGKPLPSISAPASGRGEAKRVRRSESRLR
jgi:F-type H+-transporting ATPase subunit b